MVSMLAFNGGFGLISILDQGCWQDIIQNKNNLYRLLYGPFMNLIVEGLVRIEPISLMPNNRVTAVISAQYLLLL